MIKILLLALLLSNCAIADQTGQENYKNSYDRCIDDAGPINNAAVVGCSEDTSSAVKVEINTLYAKIYDGFLTDFPQDAIKLEKSQKSWIVYRNNQCELAGSHIGSPMYSFCPMMLNIERVNELRELAGE